MEKQALIEQFVRVFVHLGNKKRCNVESHSVTMLAHFVNTLCCQVR